MGIYQEMLVRYAVLIVLGLFDLAVFYAIFTPLTVYPVFKILSTIDETTFLLAPNIISLKDFYFELVPACIAGAAYYFLCILNLTTPMPLKKRVKSLGFLLGAFLGVNILRILIFIWLAVVGFQYFDVTHRFVWYVGSTIFVVALWFMQVWLFKIKKIPVYSDLRGIVTFMRVRKKR